MEEQQKEQAEQLAAAAKATFESEMAKFDAATKSVLETLEPLLKILLVDHPPASIAEKREHIDRLNKLFYAAGVAIKHPTLGGPTTLDIGFGPRSTSGYIRIRATSGGLTTRLPLDKPIELIPYQRTRKSSPGGAPGEAPGGRS